MIQSGGTKLRYATLMGIKKAKTKELRKISAAELGQAARPLPCSKKSRCRKSRNPRRSSPAPPKKLRQLWSKN